MDQKVLYQRDKPLIDCQPRQMFSDGSSSNALLSFQFNIDFYIYHQIKYFRQFWKDSLSTKLNDGLESNN